jgi:hypothetical protein
MNALPKLGRMILVGLIVSLPYYRVAEAESLCCARLHLVALRYCEHLHVPLTRWMCVDDPGVDNCHADSTCG